MYKHCFYFSKQMKIKIPMENLSLTPIVPMLRQGVILLHALTQRNTIGRMLCKT